MTFTRETETGNNVIWYLTKAVFAINVLSMLFVQTWGRNKKAGNEMNVKLPGRYSRFCWICCHEKLHWVLRCHFFTLASYVCSACLLLHQEEQWEKVCTEKNNTVLFEGREDEKEGQHESAFPSMTWDEELNNDGMNLKQEKKQEEKQERREAKRCFISSSGRMKRVGGDVTSWRSRIKRKQALSGRKRNKEEEDLEGKEWKTRNKVLIAFNSYVHLLLVINCRWCLSCFVDPELQKF